MNKVKQIFWGFLLALTALWWVADGTTFVTLDGLFAWRNVLVQYSGVLSIGVMSISMLLAVRPVVFEPHVGGLDKMYRLHKWLGISALVTAVAHWVISQGPKWLIGLGLIERRPRGPRPPLPEEAIHRFLATQHGLVESIGEWAFYAGVVLMVLALIKRFPYKHFLKTHHVLAISYLLLAWHSVVLLQWDYWSTPLGVLMSLLLAGGSVCAVLVLLGRVARSRKVLGEVVTVRQHTALQVTQIDIQFKGQWAGHDAGQFAFVTLHAEEGAHPYTISSAWKNDGLITFIIKALGDYTGTLSTSVSLGDQAVVEGPYGRFNFEGIKRRQIWIGGGIGITPFVARMKSLALESDNRKVDLFHTTAIYDEHVMQLMQKDAQDAGVNLHVLWSQRDGRLDAQRIASAVPEWKDADFWFCGPAEFGRALKAGLVGMGLASDSFHQELFEMR